MRLGVTLWTLALVLLPSSQLAADEPVTFKEVRAVKRGDQERIEVNDSDVTRIDTIAGRRVVDSMTSRSAVRFTCSVEYLGSDTNPHAKQIVTFDRVNRSNDGRAVPLNLDGRKVVAERRDGKTGHRLANGKDLSENELHFLQVHFGENATDNSNSGGAPGGSLIDAFWPKKPVAVNKSWPCDTELLAKQALTAFEGLTLDPDKSHGQGTLLQVYDLDGVTYAKIKIEAKLAVVRSEEKDAVMKFDPPLVLKFAGNFDACIDGTTANMTGDVKWSARGTAKAKRGDGEETLVIDMSGRIYKKYTRLKK